MREAFYLSYLEKKLIIRTDKNKIADIKKRFIWVWAIAKNYWKQIIIYTLLGLTSVIIGLLSGFVSRDMVDIITGHRVGAVITTFAIMIGVTLANTLISQISAYVSTKVNLHVETELKRDIFRLWGRSSQLRK